MSPLTLAQFEDAALGALCEFGAIPSLSPQFDPHWHETGHIEAALQQLIGWTKERRLADVRVDVSRIEGRTPVLLVTVGATGDAAGTCLLYGHLDKQPPLGEWSEGLAPFAPVRRGNRLYGRGLADDGYSIFAALLALESLESNAIPHARCVVLIEASEESGSPDLEAHLDVLGDELGDVDLLICLDSGALSYDRLWVTSSLRGLVNLQVTVSVLERAQHSGGASGAVPSSFRVLRQLLDRVEDSGTGRVLVPELHCEIPADVAAAAEALTAEFGDVIAHGMPTTPGLELMGDSPAERVLATTWRPALSIIGADGLPSPADAGNVLRTSTTAVLSMRLPPPISAADAAAAMIKILTTEPPDGALVEAKVNSLADGWVAPTPPPWLAVALEDASTRAFGRPPAITSEGGSIPFLASLGRRYPGVQFVATGVVGPEANAHGLDEMLNLDAAVAVTNAVATVVAAHAARKESST